MKYFKTHTGKIVRGKKLVMALNSIADDLLERAHKIRNEDDYASHITNESKDRILNEAIEDSERIRNPNNIKYELWLFQRLNTKLTGECIALLP